MLFRFTSTKGELNVLLSNIKHMKKEVGIIGLGKMGGNMARRLKKHGWRVVGWSPNESEVRVLTKQKAIVPAHSISDMAGALETPRTIVVMVPAGKPVDEVLFGKEGLANILSRGDTIIDAGNSFFEDTIRRGKKVTQKGIMFLDAGTSGGPAGALNGACMMVGGDTKTFARVKPLFADLAKKDAVQFFDGIGAGHFVKMVHNGIEYGMMQAIGEGFEVLKKSKYHIDLNKAVTIYNNGSVIESRLVGWLQSGYKKYGTHLKDMSGTIGHSGEGEWTVKTAKKLKVPVPVIEESFQFRVRSAKKPSYTGQVVAVLRNQFGGHLQKKGERIDSQ